MKLYFYFLIIFFGFLGSQEMVEIEEDDVPFKLNRVSTNTSSLSDDLNNTQVIKTTNRSKAEGLIDRKVNTIPDINMKNSWDDSAIELSTDKHRTSKIKKGAYAANEFKAYIGDSLQLNSALLMTYVNNSFSYDIDFFIDHVEYIKNDFTSSSTFSNSSSTIFYLNVGIGYQNKNHFLKLAANYTRKTEDLFNILTNTSRGTGRNIDIDLAYVFNPGKVSIGINTINSFGVLNMDTDFIYSDIFNSLNTFNFLFNRSQFNYWRADFSYQYTKNIFNGSTYQLHSLSSTLVRSFEFLKISKIEIGISYDWHIDRFGIDHFYVYPELGLIFNKINNWFSIGIMAKGDFNRLEVNKDLLDVKYMY